MTHTTSNLMQGKTAIVTGAADGIGRASALLLAREGAAVVAADINETGARETAAQINAGGGQAVTCRVDVALSADVQEMVALAVATYGGLDILVNNAAIINFKGVLDTEEDEWDRLIAVNLKSVFLGCRFALPHLLERAGSAIVNIASVHAFANIPNCAAYAASKGGVVALTRQMALDYSPRGVRINCVCPGAVATPMNLNSYQREPDPAAAFAAMEAAHALKRIGQPEEIAELVGFLAGPRASFITGAAYLADGGLLASM